MTAVATAATNIAAGKKTASGLRCGDPVACVSRIGVAPVTVIGDGHIGDHVVTGQHISV